MSVSTLGEASNSPKVLVVEDEAGLRFLTSDSLSLYGGFTVVEAASADEAVEILKTDADIRCVFTDVRMPGRYDGLDLSRHIKQFYPAIPVIMTSGNLRPGELLADVPFMTKPYDLATLSTAIWDLIRLLKPAQDQTPG